MTSLQTDWNGYYLDGQTVTRRAVKIRILRLGLQINGEVGESIWWPLEEIRQTQGFYAGEQVRLERGGEFAEVLLVAGTSFLTNLHHMIPKAADQFYNPANRKNRIRIIALAAGGYLAVVALLYLWGIPMLAAIVASRVPVSWEEHLGQEIVKHLAPEDRRCDDPVHTRAIGEILRTLTSPQPTSPYTYRIYIVNNPMINAFAAPGGYIMLMRGLLEQTESPEELAGVLAHELQHVRRRHATRILIQQASMGLLLSAMTGNTSGATSYGLETARAFGILHYSRRIEEEADKDGMRMILDAGIDPNGMIKFFDILKKKSTEIPSVLKYLSTHPSTEERIQKLRTMATGGQRKPSPLLKNYDWSAVKNICP
jgi:Zn-dependent protease with chaperone function